MAEVCMVCGSVRDVLTRNHLLVEHGITMEEYRAVYGSGKAAARTLIGRKKRAVVNFDEIKTTGRKIKPAWMDYSVS